MAGFGYVAALVLALAFVRAGVAKVLAPGPTRTSFVALGVPAPDAAARVVPAVEVALGVALVAVPPVGAAVALALLAFFTTFLAGRLRAGVRAPCGCFGAASSAELSGLDLVRNALLGALALAALAADRPVVPRPGHVVLVVATTLLGASGLALIRNRRSAPDEGG
ncbi:MAG: MauE/DoxX family redox-associated membrane protein [Acidimicrobiales bacterium]